MVRFQVLLSSINDVKNFVDAACTQSCEIDLISGRYTVNAKSIIGIFSIDLTKPITVEIHGSDTEADAFCSAVSAYIVD